MQHTPTYQLNHSFIYVLFFSSHNTGEKGEWKEQSEQIQRNTYSYFQRQHGCVT